MTEILNRLKQMRAIIEDDIAKNTGLEGESNVQVAVIPECVEIKILDKQTTCKSIAVNYKIRNMKKYIGTKTVSAEPMLLGEFIKQTGRNPYVNDPKVHDNSEEGYIIEYEDSYKSWSPKDVFEKAYKVADTPLDRLHIEMRDLYEKLDKLVPFIDSGKMDEVIKDNYQKFLLLVQHLTMSDYVRILETRIGRMDGAPEAILNHMNFGTAIQALKLGFAIRRSGWNGKGLFVVKQIPAHITEEIIPKMQSLPQSAKDLILKGKGFIDYTFQCLIYNENTGRADSWVPSISDVFAEDWEIVID